MIYKIMLICLLTTFIFTQETLLQESNKTPQKVLIFSYGSLVKQKDNKKTGALLHASPFTKTSLELPLSFTFIAGLPPSLVNLNKKRWNSFPRRRATVTIDVNSHEYKPLWVATSNMSSLDAARNNLAAREGAPFTKENQSYDLTHIFYIKKVSNTYKKRNNEKPIPGFKNWITLRAKNRRQQLSIPQLQKLVAFTIAQKADAAIWAALPSHLIQEKLDIIIENDPQFTANTAKYIQKMPPGNKATIFEKKVMKLNASYN